MCVCERQRAARKWKRKDKKTDGVAVVDPEEMKNQMRHKV